MTATAKPKQIDWTEPIEVRDKHNTRWRSARVLRTDLRGPLKVAIAIDEGDYESVLRVSGDDVWCDVRNTPAPPVPFEFVRWFVVYRSPGGNFQTTGEIYTDECVAKDAARRHTSGKAVMVPVTIRGEWNSEEVQGG